MLHDRLRSNWNYQDQQWSQFIVRTLSTLSTTAATQQKGGTGKNYPYFQKYLDYFGTSANTIYNSLRVKAATPPNLAAVKAAFESTYKCIGIKCGDVGGQWNSTTSTYFPGADPCVDV
jgi:hypothetical protein